MREGQVLLSRRAGPPKKDQWDLVGGFIEANETPEAAGCREVREETGCKVTNLVVQELATGEYAGRPTLNFLATGRIAGTPRAGDDSAELRWWPLDKLPKLAWRHEAAFLAVLGRKRQ